MKGVRKTGPFQARSISCWAAFAVVSLQVSTMQAQSSVTITVEDTHGKAIANVRVMGQRVEQKKGIEEALVGDLFVPSKSEGKTYTISGLAKGKYKFYACEPELKVEPDYKEISVGENEAKKFPLILQEQDTSQSVNDPDLKPGSRVCLVHEETGCSAIKVIEANGEVKYAGVRSHYRLEEADACKKD